MASCGPNISPSAKLTDNSALRTATIFKRLAINVPRDVAAELPQLVVSDHVQPAVLRAAPPFPSLAQTSAADSDRALICLTGAIYYEARSQSEDGQRAVAQVVLNRVRNRAFPKSVCGVVMQGSNRSTGCQFSFTCDRSMDQDVDREAWIRAHAIAKQALAGAVYAPVGSATFYHATYVQPWWAASMDKIATIGAHIFYRWAPALESRLAFRQLYSGQEPTHSDLMEGYASPAPAYRAVQQVGSVSIYRSISPMVKVDAVTETVKHPGSTDTLFSTRKIAGVRIYRGGT
jgi:hypothetical protein